MPKKRKNTEKELYSIDLLEIGARIMVLRKKAGLKQEDISNKFKIPQQAISRVENGKANTNYFFEVLYKVCKEFNVSLDWVVFEKGKVNIKNTTPLTHFHYNIFFNKLG